jgi:hypothetical protein
MRWVRTGRGLVAVLAVTALVGCGGDDNGGDDANTLDTAPLEDSLTSSIGGGAGGGSSLGGGPQVEDVRVDCPDDVEQKAGATFECGVSAVAGGSAPQPGEPVEGRVRVELKNDEGTKFETQTKIEGGGLTQESSGDLTIQSK